MARPRSFGIPIVFGLLVGGAIALSTNAVIYGAATSENPWTADPFGFWGLVYGTFSALAAFGLAVVVTSKTARARRTGWILSSAVFGLFGVAVLWWIVMWGVSPLTLEGLWMWPLALSSLAIAAVLAYRSRRTRLKAPPR